jgi:hypothetical protein
MRLAALLAGAPALLLLGCADDAPQASPPAIADVAGDYDTTVTLLDSTCTGIEVEDQPTTVEQHSDQHSDQLTLTHAALTFHARFDGSRFVGEPVAVPVGDDIHTLTVTGSFARDALDATVAAVVTGSQECRYDVAWMGSRK